MTISFRYHNGLGASALGGLQRSRKDMQEDIMDDITKQPYAKWLEESIATIAGLDPCCICFAATKADGTVFTGYYNADATDKAVFAHNIQADIVMDIIKANADTISGILEDGK